MQVINPPRQSSIISSKLHRLLIVLYFILIQINSDVTQNFSLRKGNNSSRSDTTGTSSSENCCALSSTQTVGDIANKNDPVKGKLKG